MPNLKIYVDDALYRAAAPALADALEPVRACLMRHLRVARTACQLAVLPVLALPDQPRVNIELQILPHPDRTRACLTGLGADLRAILTAATGHRAAFRCVQHDPKSYVVTV